MKYEIPKEIKAKPKILGLEMRELVIILISSLLLLTILRDLVHSVFMIPYIVVAVIGMIYLFLPSGQNPDKRVYESMMLWFRNKKGVYHAIDHHKNQNIATHEEVQSTRRSDV
ncbi:DUF5592 family protein [Virgibacillus ihumii]|uniref:DUF5592 family protein n=1 Tax=Virgibacillus ihumii TaxID=2686091 RepID=UPI00157C6B87|nr:DUF5592 family protein [Virgibacillus ihumii]